MTSSRVTLRQGIFFLFFERLIEGQRLQGPWSGVRYACKKRAKAKSFAPIAHPRRPQEVESVCHSYSSWVRQCHSSGRRYREQSNYHREESCIWMGTVAGCVWRNERGEEEDDDDDSSGLNQHQMHEMPC